MQKGMGEAELAAELAELMGYYRAEKVNKETTIAGELVATIFYHEQFMRM